MTLFVAPREEHSRLRRQLAQGFSEKSMREQQPIITGYVDALIRRLYEKSAGGTRAVDMVRCKLAAAPTPAFPPPGFDKLTLWCCRV